jgi:phosphate transport system permease protein
MEASPASPSAPAAASPSVLRRTRHLADRIGDTGLHVLTAVAAAVAMLIIAGIVWKVFEGAWPAIEDWGLSFVWESGWDPITETYAAWQPFIVGTLVTSFGAVLLAAPLSIAIGLFLSELAPNAIRGPIGTLVAMLAAVPSVVVGLWGIFVLGPFMLDHVEPFLHDYVGWIPLFSGTPQQSGMLPAIVVLTIMIIPITSSICRELFLSVPRDVKEASLGLGATRWEMVRGVVLPYVRGGVVAAVTLGLGRALGEAIAVTQVIGNTVQPLDVSLFSAGNTLASQLASSYVNAPTNKQVEALLYLALILLAITFVTNVAAQLVVRRFERQFGRT